MSITTASYVLVRTVNASMVAARMESAFAKSASALIANVSKQTRKSAVRVEFVRSRSDKTIENGRHAHSLT
jgi:rhamnogalacturonyl hydrolase YesR